MAEWLRRSVSDLEGFTRVGSNPVVGITNQKPTANSAVHPFEVGKWVLRSNSERYHLRAQAVMPQAHISCIAARNPRPTLTNQNKTKKNKERQNSAYNSTTDSSGSSKLW